MKTQHLGSLLKTLRIERQMTQEYVSEGICSRRHLINIESGKVLPNFHPEYLSNKKRASPFK
jgi:DNA-binding XRE family transcriptional regulator